MLRSASRLSLTRNRDEGSRGSSTARLTPEDELERQIEHRREHEESDRDNDNDNDNNDGSDDGHKFVLAAKDAELAEMRQMVKDLVQAMSARPAAAATTPSTSKIVKMKDPNPFCGGAMELETFLSRLHQNFKNYAHMFPSEEIKVDYACNHLGTWAEHSKRELRETNAMDPVVWATELRNAKDPCLLNFEDFETAIFQMYGDKDRVPNAVLRMFEHMKQANDETVRAYEQRCKSMWREADWSGCPERYLYDFVWAGLRPGIISRIKQHVTREDNRFESLTELFTRAAAADTTRPNQKQQQKQSAQTTSTMTSTPTSSNQNQPKPAEKGKKRPFRPSISSGSGTTSTASITTPDTKPKAKWRTKIEYESLIARRLCVRCESPNHKYWDCPTYSAAERPSHLTGGESTVKRQRSFDNRGSKSSSGAEQASKN